MWFFSGIPIIKYAHSKKDRKVNLKVFVHYLTPMGLDEVAEIARGGRLTMDLGGIFCPGEKQHIHLWIAYN